MFADPGYNNRPVGSGSHILEEENDKLTQGLSEKVRALKSVSHHYLRYLFIYLNDARFQCSCWCLIIFYLQLTIDIGHEVRDQNKYLREMVSLAAERLSLILSFTYKSFFQFMFFTMSQDTDFDNSGGFLQRTMGRVKQLSRQGHNCWIMVYLTLFALAVFLVCWLILKFR